MKAVGFGNAMKEHEREAAEQVLVVIKNSSADGAGDVSAWAEKVYPTDNMTKEETENLTEFLCTIAVRTRVTMRMSRIGVVLKLLMTLSMGYMDALTDFLVAKSYYDTKIFNTAYATAGFAVLAIVIQAVITLIQYGKKSWREHYGLHS
ncbi:hypothetical protein TrLO_g4559 [Triparma laevis f. longispina]|uniref:Uncharacterized protein n=1 Tax=Triparma laevis f. longispina TaxID=1714387 RepID=A0A9W6Z5H2_9STRA|nr:hypothetical protein TrLO_g4559 [Triparma laevis f. longispina]